MRHGRNFLYEDGADEGGGGTSESAAVTVEWDGKMLTPEEVKEELDKAQELVKGANKKFQEAAELRREAREHGNEAEQRLQDLQRVNEGDLDACKRLLADGTLEGLGLDAQVREYVNNMENSQQQAQQTAGQVPAAAPRKLTVEDLPEEVQDELAESRREKNKAIRERIRGQAEEFLDKDPVIGGILKKNEGLRKRVLKEVESALRRRAQEAFDKGDRAWKPTSPGVLRDVSQEVRTYLKDVGWLSDTEQEDGSSKTARSHPSVGRTSTGNVSPLYQVEDPGKRPSARDSGDYSEWVAKKINSMITEDKD
jgi:hypothetical protein